MVAIFNFLRQKGVKRVLSVLVDDMDVPAHSDESIEHALEGLKVEVWNWRKFDLCVETIRVAAPEAREVHLYWSGNNTVLNGWSAPGGLDLLKDLKQVHLHVNQGSETARRTRNNVRQFEARLKRNRPGIIFDEPEEYQPEKYETQNAPTNSSVDLDKNRHRWLECMDEFADFIQNVEPPRQLYEPITIALIDDGVDINELSLHDKIVGGRSFSQRKGFLNASRPYYVTNGGHGTVMGSLICRVCPRAKLFILKLDEYISDQSRRQITASSAAKAVRAAIERKVHIISMSWTIERTKHNVKDIADLEAAIEAAAKAGILMFCAANDQGISRDESFPSACGGTKHLFKIGAAEASGVAWKWVQMTDVDFIFPGHNVVKDRPKDAPLDKCRTLTGSSVATAIAAGLSALVLYCIQVGAINMEDSSQQQGQKYNAIKRKDYEDIKAYDRMKEAFLAIGTSQDSGNKYIEVWHTFENAPKKAVGAEKEKRLEIITELAERLKTRKTFE
ncbi:MAG: hypothetical protein M1833_000696 [Piccolia ochrophora]|nr:MAG: hypothetical protein M1833_000696 [Piccolia ochrophora]